MRFDTKEASLQPLQKMLLLRRIPEFKKLDNDDLLLIAENVQTRTLCKGDVLFSAGEMVTSTHRIIDGRVRIEDANGQAHYVDSSLVGVGSLTMFAQQSANTTAIAEEESFTLVLQCRDIFELFEKRSTILCFVIEYLARQVNHVRSATGYHKVFSSTLQQALPDLDDKLDVVNRTQLLKQMLTLSNFRISIAFEMARHAKPVTLLPGAELWNAGEVANHFYLIVDGVVECQPPLSTNTFMLGPRDAVGLIDTLANAPYSYDARVSHRVRALRVPADSFWRVISDNHEFGISVLSLAAGIALDLMRKNDSLQRGSTSTEQGSDLSDWMDNLPESSSPAHSINTSDSK